MKKYIAILLLIFSAPIYAETFLCLGEAGAGVTYDTKTRLFESSTYNVSDQKFILSNKDGKWTFSRFGVEYTMLECVSEFYCSLPGGFSGSYFIKSNKNVFVYYSTGSSQDGVKSESIVVRGFCSSI